jgi:hypothetical protein
LHIWDHFTYDADLALLKDHLLPAFEGLADFFMQYLIPCYSAEGDCDIGDRSHKNPESGSRTVAIYHTGPTTSPESAFEFKTSPGDTGKYANAGFTPGIDSSVLRQVSFL